MQRATLEEAFRFCRDNPENLSATELLDRFPEYREELAALLALDQRLAAALPRPLPADARAAIKARMLAAAARPAPAPTGQPSAPRARRRPWWMARPLWALGAALVILALLWSLVATALPDNPLYALKLSAENAGLVLTSEPAALARAHLDLANERLRDVRTMQVAGKLAQTGPAFEDYDQHLSTDRTLVRALNGDPRIALDKLLYISSVAGQRTIAGFGSLVGQLPSSVRVSIAQTQATLDNLNQMSAQELQGAQVNLGQLLNQAGPQLGPLLTPVPGAALPSPTVPPATPTPACADSYENDGVAAQARPIQAGESQTHYFCVPGDADWVSFTATADQGYEIAATDDSGANAYIFLFAPDGQTVVERSQPAPGNSNVAQIVFHPATSGRYYAQVKNQDDLGGVSMRYTLTLREVAAPTATREP